MTEFILTDTLIVGVKVLLVVFVLYVAAVAAILAWAVICDIRDDIRHGRRR